MSEYWQCFPLGTRTVGRRVDGNIVLLPALLCTFCIPQNVLIVQSGNGRELKNRSKYLNKRKHQGQHKWKSIREVALFFPIDAPH